MNDRKVSSQESFNEEGVGTSCRSSMSLTDDMTNVLFGNKEVPPLDVNKFTLNAPWSKGTALPVEFEVCTGNLDANNLLDVENGESTIIPFSLPYKVAATTTRDLCFAAAAVPEDGTNGTTDQEEGNVKKWAATRIAKQKKPAGSVPDNVYFDRTYRDILLSSWKVPYDKNTAFEYLGSGAQVQKRGWSYVKFVPTLSDLQKEYLSPDEFVKYEGKLFEW